MYVLAKFVLCHGALHAIASVATWNGVFWSIPNRIVLAVNAVVNEQPLTPFEYIARNSRAVMAIAFD